MYLILREFNFVNANVKGSLISQITLVEISQKMKQITLVLCSK